MMAKDPAERFATYDDLLTSLHGLDWLLNGPRSGIIIRTGTVPANTHAEAVENRS
jgi:hypothetical protein